MKAMTELKCILKYLKKLPCLTKWFLRSKKDSLREKLKLMNIFFCEKEVEIKKLVKL